ncbi:hypothetical protein R3P38DRAFT_3290187 [Favolaschia claudopus]|uniref:HAM1-like N-terminal domain-containing protein n=1 Tax=Favolaschia claudopus TaxID=2862362 RepID=A0AAV9ZT05_9AGAR
MHSKLGTPKNFTHLIASSDADTIRNSLRTILSIAWESLSSEGSFLFTARPRDGLREDGQRDALGRDRKRLEEEQDVRVAFEHGMDTLKDTGSSMIGAGHSAKATTEDVSDRTTSRLQASYDKIYERAQKDPAYRSALATLFNTAHQWITKAFDTANDESLTLNSTIEDSSPEQHIHKAVQGLQTLIDRFAKPNSSVDEVLQKAQHCVSAFRKDSAEAKAWIDKFFEHAHKTLEDPDYSHSAEARTTRRNLRQRARTLLDLDTEAGRLGQDVERGLVEAGEKAETGVEAVLERAAWFWRDLFAVYAPRLFAMLKDIPIPRTEYVDNDLKLVLENLDISFALNPAHIFVRNITDVEMRTSETAPATTGVGTFTHIRLQAVQLALRVVSFYYKDKTATVPPSEYTGLLALKMPPQGIDIDIKVRLIPSAKERQNRRAFHHIELLTVQIADNVEVDVCESNHAIML